MRLNTPRLSLRSVFILAATLIGVVVLLASVNSAGAQGGVPKNPEGREITDAMQAYLQDREALPASAALSGVPCSGGSASGYPCSNVDLAAFVPHNTLDGSSQDSNDIWGWTSADGREFALHGRRNGVNFVEVTNPMSPVVIGTLPTANGNSDWRDIKTYADHAFVVSERSGHGMQVFDLTQLLTATPGTTFSEDARYTGFGSAHNIVIDEYNGFAYAVGAFSCSGGLHMVNIQNPTSPVFEGCFSADGYTHDAQCTRYNGPDLDYIGREICFNSNEDTLTIVDVTDKSNPVQLSRQSYPGDQYTHQSWLSEDQAYLLLDDELDEANSGVNTRTHIWDVSDLNNPTRTGFHDSALAAIDHNQYIHGRYTFQSNYRAGLRILDAYNIDSASLTEVAYFDVYPSSNSASFNGNWSNYPYFESGTVVVSHIEEGLFVLQPDLGGDIRFEPTEVVVDVCTTGSTTFDLQGLWGYGGNANLAISGVPAGATASFSNQSANVPYSSSLTITQNSAAVGSYLLTVTASAGAISYDEYIRLNITCPGGGGDLDVTLTPIGAPISVPSCGGTFMADLDITNTTGASETFDAWVVAILPNGNTRKVAGPASITLADGATFSRTLNQFVPAGAPTGTYSYEAYIGDFPGTIDDSDAFPFTKTTASCIFERSRPVLNWSAYGLR